jgi:alpha-tubulin suppressor-like RCC1 family protein
MVTGSLTSFALTQDGHINAWRDNANGQLARGRHQMPHAGHAPRERCTGALSNVPSISGGYYVSMAATK